MSDLHDFDLSKPVSEEEPETLTPAVERAPIAAPWIVVALGALALLAGGGYLLSLRGGAPAAGAASTAPSPPAVSQAPVASPLDLRALGESDALVRELARDLSHDPLFVGWLSSKDLVRRLVGAVVQVSAGEAPRAALDFLSSTGGFVALETPTRIVIDRRSFGRYDGIVAVVASLDGPACARVLRQTQPLLDSAHAELGRPHDRFSISLERALRLLLVTPALDGDVELRHSARAAAIYEYADPRLESLKPAQKHLIRMGPGNARTVKAKLRELAQALDLAPF